MDSEGMVPMSAVLGNPENLGSLAIDADEFVQLLEVIKFATMAHGLNEQLRKYTNDPYIVHPIEVMQILALHGCSPTVLKAGVLHDVVEDTGFTIDDLRRFFGRDVANLVEQVTQPPMNKGLSRKERLQANLLHLKNASADAQTIKCADIASNVGVGQRSLAVLDPVFASHYLDEKIQTLELLVLAEPRVRKLALQRIDANLVTMSQKTSLPTSLLNPNLARPSIFA